jgi:cellobiose epimerase
MIATGEKTISLTAYKDAVDKELQSILSWWSKYMVDERGGFYGSVDTSNIPDLDAAKGVVLNSRILWTFSAAAKFTNNKEWLTVASRAFKYLLDHFIDPVYGGLYWSVDPGGVMLDGKKQVYGQAFGIYSLTEYYKATGDETALNMARELFDCIESYSYDTIKGGYIEAFTRDWKPIEDLRLSEKDDNEKKTMNTHLHVIEAYANLYMVWPDQLVRERIVQLLELFDTIIINKNDHHLHLFMNENWQVRSSLVSFGHDVEAAWLLLECAVVVDDQLLIEKYKTLSVQLAAAASKGLDEDGGLWYELDPVAGQLIYEKHSWPQAEAMVGFFNAWQVSKDAQWLLRSKRSFDFIDRSIRDHKNGEWYWGIYKDGLPMPKEKAGFWKCPYHSARACMEISSRIARLKQEEAD